MFTEFKKPADRILTPHEIIVMILIEMGYRNLTLEQVITMLQCNAQLEEEVQSRFEEEMEEERKRARKVRARNVFWGSAENSRTQSWT